MTEIKVLAAASFKRIFGFSQLIPGPNASGLSLLAYPSGGVAAMTAVYLGLLLPGYEMNAARFPVFIVIFGATLLGSHKFSINPLLLMIFSALCGYFFL